MKAWFVDDFLIWLLATISRFLLWCLKPFEKHIVKHLEEQEARDE